VASILYSKNAKVWLAARHEDKTRAAITDIKNAFPKSRGDLFFRKLDLRT
jgi:hypothetical protein